MKKLQLLFSLLFILLVSGKATTIISSSIDTIQLKEVNVYPTPSFYIQSEKHILRFDSIELQNNQNQTLAELLQNYSPVYVKSYGTAGSISTLSMRGGSASHTQVLWNGFPLNSLTTGEMDLSLVNSDFADQVKVIYGAPGALYGSGTFGGAIELNTLPEWNNRLSVNGSTELGSFNSHRYSMKMKVGSSNIQYQFQGFMHDALNNFPFNDNYKNNTPRLTLRHNTYSSQGLLQTLHYKTNLGFSADAGLWWQQRAKELPPVMGSFQSSNQEQQDSTMKLFLTFKQSLGTSSLRYKTAYFSDYIHFTDKASPFDSIYSIDSQIRSNRFFNDISWKGAINRIITLETGISANRFEADVANYGGNILENQYSAYLYTRMALTQSVTGSISLRQDIIKGIDTRPQASLALSYQLPRELAVLRGNVASRYRIPGFNDRYWSPGGNPSLKPESGITWELGTDIPILKLIQYKNAFDFTYYQSDINDWIQWIPVTAYWSPVNYKHVRSQGVESGITQSYSGRIGAIRLKSSYQYTRAEVLSTYDNSQALIHKQLRYTPEHTGNFTAGYTYNHFSLSYIGTYRGSCFINEDNSGYPMPAVWLTYIQTGTWINVKGTRLRLDFRIHNLFDKQYQMIRSYAMPGRAYYVTFQVQFTKTN